MLARSVNGILPDLRFGADALFRIASMTKAITTVAALQLVEQGKVDLSEPVSRHLPQLANLDVLEGFDANGTPSASARQDPNYVAAFIGPHLRLLLRHVG